MVGETGRTLETRLKEYKRAVRYDGQNNSIAIYGNTTCHAIQWEDADILTKEQHLHTWMFKSSTHQRSN